MPRTLTLSTSAFDNEVFRPVKLSGREYINELFRYELILKTPDLEGHQFYQQYGSQSPAANVDLTQWLGQSITINLELDGKEIEFSEVNNTIRQYFKKNVGKGYRHLSGIITTARFLYNQGRSSYYLIEFRPFLYSATLRQDCKIFQDKTPIQILDEILLSYPGPVQKRLAEQNALRYPKRDYQTQFLETDFQFFARISAEWGINYWFEHNGGGHTLVLSDETEGHRKLPSEAYHKIAYYPPDHKTTEEYLHEFNIIAQMVSGCFASGDYKYSQASNQIQAQQHNIQPYPEAEKQGVSTLSDDSSTPEGTAQAVHQIYDYAADVAQPEAGPNQEGNDATGEQQLRNKWNLERIQQQHLHASADGHIRGMACGHIFQLEKHPSALANINWTIRGTEILVMDLAEETQRQENNLFSLLTDNRTNSLSKNFTDSAIKNLNKLLGSSNQKWLIECTAELNPAQIPIRPQIIDKPKGSLQNALVVGEADSDAIYTDRYGRIKVQFYWDRYGSQNQNSSCWIRVNQPWAGNQMGAVFTPRIGQEVLVDFIHNDPDLPVCIGKVSNNDNLPNWQLNQNKALSGFRSRELPTGNSASGRSNHLVFDDTEKHIQTQIKSDHAHSQLSLGDITRVENNQGRKDPRGQGFELRTDDWGAIRASKGIYMSTFDRQAASGESMDASEAAGLFTRSHELNQTLEKLATDLEAEAFGNVDLLKTFSKDINQTTSTDPAADESPAGFRSEHIVCAATDSIGMTANQNILSYSALKTNLTAGEDLEVTTGNSWLASVMNKLSFVARRSIQLFSAKGKVQIHANENDIDIIAEKVLNLISTTKKVNIAAAEEIELTAAGSSIVINSKGIFHYTGGEWEAYAAAISLKGPQTKSQAKTLPKADTGLSRFQLSSLPEGAGVIYANEPYTLYKGDEEIKSGVTDNHGNVTFKYEEGAKYKVELTDKVEFNIDGVAQSLEDIQLAQGYRAANSSSAGIDDTTSIKRRYELKHLTGKFDIEE